MERGGEGGESSRFSAGFRGLVCGQVGRWILIQTTHSGFGDVKFAMCGWMCGWVGGFLVEVFVT